MNEDELIKNSEEIINTILETDIEDKFKDEVRVKCANNEVLSPDIILLENKRKLSLE